MRALCDSGKSSLKALVQWGHCPVPQESSLYSPKECQRSHNSVHFAYFLSKQRDKGLLTFLRWYFWTHFHSEVPPISFRGKLLKSNTPHNIGSLKNPKDLCIDELEEDTHIQLSFCLGQLELQGKGQKEG